jgi:hypothetical protein
LYAASASLRCALITAAPHLALSESRLPVFPAAAAAAAAAVGCMQLACFGIMAAFQLAVEHCQQQQHAATMHQHPHQQEQRQQQGCLLSSFWPVWHSYLPSGLLAAAAAAAAGDHHQQQLPQQHHARLAGQLLGPWLGVLSQRGLLQNLQSMAEAYDEVRGRRGNTVCSCMLSSQIGVPVSWSVG